MTDYLSAVGAMRVWETDLLDQIELQKMLGAKSFPELFQMLRDVDFGKFLDEVKEPEQFEKVLKMALYHVKEEIRRFLPHAPALDVLWLQYDLHNAKVMLKGLLLKNDPEAFVGLTLPYGTKSIPAMRSFFEPDQHEIQKADIWIQEAVQRAVEAFENSQDPLQAEYALDHAFLEKITDAAVKSRSSLLMKFVQALRDRENILFAVRSHLRGITELPSFLKGTIPLELLSATSIDEFGAEFPFPWKEAVERGKQEFSRTGSLSQLEKELQEILLHTLEEAKSMIDGPEPLVAFFWRKQYDAQILRTLLVGKRAGLSDDLLRQILPKIPS